MPKASTGASQAISKWCLAAETWAEDHHVCGRILLDHGGSALALTDVLSTGAHYLRLVKTISERA